MTDLDLAENQLGLGALAALMAPATDNGLVRLSLFGNRVGDVEHVVDAGNTVAGLFARGRGALRSPTLAALDLGGNDLGPATLIPMCAAYGAAAVAAAKRRDDETSGLPVRLSTLELFGNRHDVRFCMCACARHVWWIVQRVRIPS